MDLLTHARRLQALARTGLAFCENVYDRERYHEIERLAAELMSMRYPLDKLELLKISESEQGYVTPKVDVRGAIIRDGKILLVLEKADGKWTLPGGWADINDSPSAAVEREIREESGFEARAVKLAAVYDRDKHPHPPYPFHSYKFFFLCELTGGSAKPNHETQAVEFFAPDALPELSTARVLDYQILRLFEHHADRSLPTEFD